MFPHDMTLDEVSKITREHNETLGMNVFIRADRGDHIIFNYMLNFEGVFPDLPEDRSSPEYRRAAILRECRGLIFDSQTGKVIARRFHKFWNLNQRPEVQINMIDFSVPHVIMDKLDGSMITPFRTINGPRRWGTKMGATEVAIPVEAHIADRPEYEKLAAAMEMTNMTPIFEWCSRQQRIVIDYPEDRLVLTHLRDNNTGAYADRDLVREIADEFGGIPTVRVFEHTIDNIDEFVEHTKGLKNLEGYVVHFISTGHAQHDLMIKLKADDYCMLHNSKEQLNLEKNAIAMILSDEIDDLLPQLDAGDRDALVAFSNAIHAGLANTARYFGAMRDTIISEIGQIDDDRLRKKAYAARVIATANDLASDDPMRPFLKGLLFRGYDVTDLMPEVSKIVAESTATQTRVDEARPLYGNVFWKDYRGQFEVDA